jgi:hypothetical protein
MGKKEIKNGILRFLLMSFFGNPFNPFEGGLSDLFIFVMLLFCFNCLSKHNFFTQRGEQKNIVKAVGTFRHCAFLFLLFSSPKKSICAVIYHFLFFNYAYRNTNVQREGNLSLFFGKLTLKATCFYFFKTSTSIAHKKVMNFHLKKHL